MSSASRPDRIVIAGATGFVGTALAARLARRGTAHVVGLTRGRTTATGAWDELVTCDLFSMKDLERALAGARHAVYLVHSMLPSARLVQATFADLDLICAENFGRACKLAGVEQIIYLGGLLPADGDANPDALSPHLASRREVEQALAGHGVPVTTLRAGMVIGPGGSSFELLSRLVRRLPAMVLPAWTTNRCQPIDLTTVVALLDQVIGDPAARGETYDIGGPDVVTYREMMETVAAALGKRMRALPVRWVSPGLSRLWVSLITGAPRALVAPLIESLRHDMVCRDRRLQQRTNLPGLAFRDAVAWCLGDARAPAAYQAAPSAKRTGVRSIQRIPLPPGRDAEWAAHEYMRWLPRGAWPVLRVEVDAERSATFSLIGTRTPLLVLRFAPERSAPNRQLFYVVAGALVRPTPRGRLEFRVTPDGAHLLTAIHEFAPRLPWWIYRATQAVVHRWVMGRFGRHLAGQLRTGSGPRGQTPDRDIPRRDSDAPPDRAAVRGTG